MIDISDIAPRMRPLPSNAKAPSVQHRDRFFEGTCEQMRPSERPQKYDVVSVRPADEGRMSTEH